MTVRKQDVALDPDAAERQIAEQTKRIEFYLTEYSVELLANKMRSDDFVVPAYQRNFTWEPERKSRFIESLMMGLPIPFVFFWEMPDGRLEIVDGSQRLRTIAEFILGDLRLGQLKELTLSSGIRFVDLPASRQRKIRNRSIRGIVLNEHADEAARFDMFERINTSSKMANSAEVRRGALIGPFLDFVIALSNDPFFTKMTPMSVKAVQERGREELVSRFFAYGDGLEGYRDRPADFIFDYSRAMNQKFTKSPPLEDKYRSEFDKTMRFVDRVFPNGFRKTESSRATFRARFEAIAVGSRLALRQRPGLAKVDAKTLHISDWIDSEEFVDVTSSDGANSLASLSKRIEFVSERLVQL